MACEHPNSVHEADEAARHLTRGVARGDRDAVAAFYERWFDFAYRQARRASGRDESFAMDIVQEVMVKAARSMPAIDDHAGVERWLTRVVCNAVIDHQRSERRRARREGQAGGVPSSPPDLDAMAWVHEQLCHLETDEAWLMRLRFVGGLKLRSIAELFGTSSDAARGRLRATIGSLRERAEKGDAHER